MARKQIEVRIPQPLNGEENRDAGKLYLLTEMPATQAEKWAMRALLAIGKSGLEVPEGAGMAQLAAASVRHLFSAEYRDVEPLMDEMMACVQIFPDPTKSKNPTSRILLEDDIEEVTTRLQLRMELFALHTGFFFPGCPSMVPGAKPLFPTPNTETSPGQ